MKRYRFRAYEIEHNGDLDRTVEDLQRAGAVAIKVEQTDFENDESALLSFEAPDVNQARAILRKFEEPWSQYVEVAP